MGDWGVCFEKALLVGFPQEMSNFTCLRAVCVWGQEVDVHFCLISTASFSLWGMLANTCNPSSWEAEAESSRCV